MTVQRNDDGTPFFAGSRKLQLDTVVRKRLLSGRGERAVQFEHLKVKLSD